MTSRKIFFLTLIGVLSLLAKAFGQSQPILEQNPASLNWFKINTPHFKIIYPEGFENEAQRMANTLETIYKPVSRTLQKEPRRISIILQNQTANSNGFVTVTPRRSEFFTVPPQDYTLLGNNDWLNLLAVHEFRHVVQYDKALTGFSKAFYYVFGGNGLSLITGISVPSWFWEGDAVGTETALTYGGRGRIPQFDLPLRTHLLTAKPYKYQKAFLRSFKDYVPNHYVLGYFMTSYVKRHYGADAWSNILTRTYNFPILPFAFSRAIKKETGLKVEGLYRKTMQELDSLWENQVENLAVTDADMVETAKNEVFTNYKFPQFLSDGGIVALKSGLGDFEQFVVLDGEGEEKKAFVPGFINDDGMLSVVNDRIVWSERGFDIRWGMRDYTVIKTYDIKTGELRQLTKRSRLSGPALSPDGRRIAALDVSESGNYNLQILDSGTGELIQTIANPGNSFYLTPRWSPDGRQLVTVKLNKQGKTIEVIDIQNNTRREIIPYTQLNISHPVWHGNYVYYNSPYSGIDNIYSVNLESGEQYQVTSRKFGAYNPAFSLDGQIIAFNDFTPDGFKVVTMPNNPSDWTPVTQVADRTVAYYQPLIEQEGNINVFDQVPQKRYKIQRYSRLKNLFNPYSWSPLLDSENNSLTVSLYSQNLLSTTLADVGYGFNANEKASSFFGRLSYQGFYPVFDLEYENTARRTAVSLVNKEGKEIDKIYDNWNEQRINVGVRLPLVLTRSKYIESLNFSTFASIRDVTGRYKEQWNGSLQAMLYSASYLRLHKKSQRDIYPRFGQTIAVHFRNTPFAGSYTGELFAVGGNLFFPGLQKHHSLRFRGGLQYEITDANYSFSSPLLFPRGHSYVNHKRLYSGSAEYHLPLLYPDLALGRWLYFQRIKGGLFFDAAYGVRPNPLTNFDQTVLYKSIGADISTEFNFMRLPILLELGVRTIYLPDTRQVIVEPLVVEVGF